MSGVQQSLPSPAWLVAQPRPPSHQKHRQRLWAHVPCALTCCRQGVTQLRLTEPLPQTAGIEACTCKLHLQQAGNECLQAWQASGRSSGTYVAVGPHAHDPDVMPAGKATCRLGTQSLCKVRTLRRRETNWCSLQACWMQAVTWHPSNQLRSPGNDRSNLD